MLLTNPTTPALQPPAGGYQDRENKMTFSHLATDAPVLFECFFLADVALGHHAPEALRRRQDVYSQNQNGEEFRFEF